MIKTILMIGAGSCIGGVARFLVFKATESIYSGSYPVGTFIVNAIGCLILGAVYAIFERCGATADQDIKLMLTVGVCGGFTTFSTFINENFSMFAEEQFLASAFYIIASITLGLAAVWLGHFLVNLF